MMLDEIDWIDAESDDEWIVDSELPGEDVYEAVRPALADTWQNATPEQIEALLQEVTRGMTIEEAESFWKSLANIGRQIAPVAGQVLSVAAPVLGGVIGGPAGAALGGFAGRAAGQALGSLGGQRPAAAPVPPMPGGVAAPRAPAPGRAMGIPAGAPAANQLLSFLQNPQLLQSLLGQVLGSAGRSAQPVGTGSATAPFGAFMNALSVLANQAAAESASDPGSSSYLYDSHGQLLADPSSPEERAAVLFGQLRATPVRYA